MIQFPGFLTTVHKAEGRGNEMTFWLGNVRRNIQRQANAIR